MKLSHLLFAPTIAVLCSCGSEEQDQGVSIEEATALSGLAVDGYLARSTVFTDTNNNGARDPWEDFAFTDDEGYYSYNPSTQTNYCATDATATQQQYCLQTDTTGLDDLVIRIDGGYDVITGEPFEGQLSRRITMTENSDITDIDIISPITSLLADIEDEDDRTSLLSSMSVTEDDLDVNYLDVDGSETVNTSLLNSALKIHKIVSILSDRLTDTYFEIGEEIGTPNDASSSIYPNLAEQIINQQSSLDTVLTDTSILSTVLDNAEDVLRQVYTRQELSLPSNINVNNAVVQREITIASGIVDVVDTVLTSDTTQTIDEIVGATRAIEAFTIKAINIENVEDLEETERAVEFFNNTEASTLITTLVEELSSDLADVTGFSLSDFGSFTTQEEIQEVSTLPAGTQAFSGLGGSQIQVSDLDLGQSPDDLEDKEIIIFFNGESEDIDGTMDICVKFIDDANIDGTLGDANIRGELVSGFWSLLGATEDNPESYTTILTLELLGSSYQAVMKPSGSSTIQDIVYEVVRFDFDGEIRAWHSENGVETSDIVPSTDQECEDLLPSRIGL